PGHDAHSIILFEPQGRILASADALWRNGFGVVFQELEGEQAFAEVGQTLDVIEKLDPAVVIPGHGPVFTETAEALDAARRRLDAYMRDPIRHAGHAAKVLIKFKLLEVQQLDMAELLSWISRTSYFCSVQQRYFADRTMADWVEELVADLVRAGAAVRADRA